MNTKKNIRDFGLHKLIFVLLQLTIITFLMTKSGVTTESGGRQNMFPSETRPYIDETVSYDGYPQNAEKVNGRWAMVGFVALLGAYVTTGQIIPGIFQFLNNFLFKQYYLILLNVNLDFILSYYSPLFSNNLFILNWKIIKTKKMLWHLG